MIWNKSKQPADPQQDAAAAPKKGGAAAFAQKNWKWLVPVAIVVLAGGWWLLKPKGAKPANVDTSYTEAVPETRDVSNTLSGTGTLKPANTYSVKSLVPGKVLTGGFEEGDIVEEGTVLYTVDSSDATTKVEQAAITLQQAQRSYDKTADHQYVRAEVAGVVSSLKVNKGDEVKSGQEVAVVRDSSKMNLVLEFPAADAANFSAGQTAQVTLDGTFEVLPGTITAVTGTDALSTGNLLTRTVTLSVSNAGGLTTAQAATATINGVSSIAAANFQYQAERTLTALASGTVTAINVREGGSVNKDDIILTLSGEELTESIQSASETLRGAELSMQNMQDAMDNYTITSPISGTIIEKNAKVGDALSTGSDLCTIYDLSYLEMTINVDELQVSSLKVGQSVQVTADAVKDKTYEGLVTRVSMKGDTSGGTTTYPVTVRIDETDGLRPGMNANAEIVVAQAKNALTVPNAAIVRGGYVLVRQDSPSAVNADDSMSAPEGYVYVKVKTGVSDDNYTQVTSGLSESDTIAYDPSSVSSDSYYDDGGYDDMGGEVIGGAGNNADLAEGGEETLPEETENDTERREILRLAEQYGVAVETVTEKTVLSFGGGELTIFPPLGAGGSNELGLTILAAAGERTFLITGDMERATEKKLLDTYSLPDVDVLMAGHHGSRDSTSGELLEAVTPETVVISVGSNSYGHPAEDTLQRLARAGCRVYRTDHHGTVYISFD